MDFSSGGLTKPVIEQLRHFITQEESQTEFSIPKVGGGYIYLTSVIFTQNQSNENEWKLQFEGRLRAGMYIL